MRFYGKVSPRFWSTSSTGRVLRQDKDATLLALYLMTNSHANMIGLYYLPKWIIENETPLSKEGASKALRRCIEGGFCMYDATHEVVWIREMAAHQIAPSMSPKDKRVKHVLGLLASYEESELYRPFVERYGEAFHLGIESPLEAPSKPLRSQEQEQEQEEEEELPASPSETPVVCAEPKNRSAPADSEPDSEVALIFPCTGPVREWGLTRAKLAEYAETYETLDVEREARRALQWLRDNPGKRKTARGMTRFLNRWMANAVDRGHGPGKPPPEPPPFPTLAQMGGADGQAAGDPETPDLSHLRYLALEQLKARLEGSALKGALAQVEAAVGAGNGPEVFRIVEAHGGQL